MIGDDDRLATAEALRAEFDASFAAPPARRPDTTALLAIRVAAAPFAVKLLEAGGLMLVRRIVPVPSRIPALLGIAGLRGEVLPVYGLARLVLRLDEKDPPRWMIVARGDGDHGQRVAFAFAGFDGHVLAAAGELHGSEQLATDHVIATYMGTQVRPVLSLTSLVAAVTSR